MTHYMSTVSTYMYATQTVTVSWLLRSWHDRSPSFESTRHQNDSWESCPVVDPSVEHSKKLKTNVNPGFFHVLLDLNT